MAGIGLESITPINPRASDFVGPDQSAVQQSAIAALSDAFRKGLVNTDDIISRYGELAQTREKAEIQGLHEYISPEAIQARKAAVAAEGGIARLKGAQAEAAVGSVPLAQQGVDAETKAKLSDALMHPDRLDLMRDVVLQVGGPVPDIDWSVGPTKEQANELRDTFSKARQYLLHVGMAQNILSQVKTADKTVKKTDSKTGATTTTTSPGAIKIVPGIGPVDDEVVHRLAGLAYTPFLSYLQNPKTVSGVLTGEHTDEPLVQPKTSAAAPAKPDVSAPAPQPAGTYVSEETAPLDVDTTNKIMEPVRKQASYQAWDAAKSFHQGMNNVYQQLKQNPDESIQGVQDIALVSDFIKLYDPSAVIREFKWDKIESSQPLPLVVKNAIDFILRNKHLAPEMRDTLVNTGNELFRAKEQGVKSDLSLAATRAQNAGIKPEDVLNPDEVAVLKGNQTAPAAATATTTPAPKTTPGAPVPVTGGHVQFVGGKWIFFPGK